MPKSNPWLTHFAKFRKAHPGMSVTEAAKKAKATYKRAQRGAGYLPQRPEGIAPKFRIQPVRPKLM